jgi:hypothetical protein
LCETGPALSKIDTSGCGRGEATLPLPFVNGSYCGAVSTTSYLFKYSRQTGEEHSRSSEQSHRRD